MNVLKMKQKISRVALFLIITVCFYTVISVMPRRELYNGSNPMLKEGELPLIVAHRGGCDEFPQNTLEAFYNAYSVDKNIMMETDVNITKDGVLILLHNELLDATTNVTGLASEWNYSDLISQRVDFGYDNPTENKILSGERRYFTVNGERRFPTDVIYPEGVTPRDEEIYLATTFEELLQAFPSSRISVEIKQSGELGLRAAKEAVRLVEKYDAFDRVVFASFHANVSREFKRMKNDRLVPDTFMYSPGIVSIVKYYALATLGIDSLYLDSISVLQIPVEKLGFRFDLERIVTSAHEHNLAVQYWTVNDEEEMHSLIKLGIDGIMTDKPTTLKKVLEEYK